MLASNTESLPSSPRFAARVLKYLAKLKGPARVPYDHREIERFKEDFEMKKANARALGRFKAM